MMGGWLVSRDIPPAREKAAICPLPRFLNPGKGKMFINAGKKTSPANMIDQCCIAWSFRGYIILLISGQLC